MSWNYIRSVLMVGFALFSMFFGSGNLVFPLEIGVAVKGEALFASLGLLLSAAVFPMLGALALFLFDGKEREMFRLLGWGAHFWVPLIALSLMGPFGVAPRCVTVAYGAFSLIVPGVHLWIFSGFFCILILLTAYNESRILPLLGSFLSPLLLLSLFIIGWVGSSQPVPAMYPVSATAAFETGVIKGYQLMDLVAAFFFSSFVIAQVKGEAKAIGRGVGAIFFPASAIAVLLLSAIYGLFVYLGASHFSQLTGLPGEKMLPAIAQAHLGFEGAVIVACAMILACFTTAIVLVDLFADFVKRYFFPTRMGPIVPLLLSLLITFAVSTLEFSGISRFLGPILQLLYPTLILFALMVIAHKGWGYSFDRRPIVALFLLSCLFFLIEQVG